VATYPVLEHRQGRASRWLRENRLRLAFGIAVAETILVLVSALQWRWAVLLAGLVFAFHFLVGRKLRYDTLRQLSWTAALSQTLPVLVPLLLVVLSTLVVIAIVAVALVVLALMLFGRR
jgi:FtsH-binding integral membrane protein